MLFFNVHFDHSSLNYFFKNNLKFNFVKTLFNLTSKYCNSHWIHESMKIKVDYNIQYHSNITCSD